MEQHGPRRSPGAARAIGAPSAWLSLAGLRPRRARLRFTRHARQHNRDTRERRHAQAINRGPSSALPITFRVVAWRHASANRPTKSRGIGRSVPVQSPMKPIRRAAARGRPRPVQQLGATPAIIRAEPRDPVGHACTRSEPVRQAARRGGAQGDGPIIRRTTLPPQGHTTASLEMADLTVE